MNAGPEILERCFEAGPQGVELIGEAPLSKGDPYVVSLARRKEDLRLLRQERREARSQEPRLRAFTRRKHETIIIPVARITVPSSPQKFPVGAKVPSPRSK
jgi:hypothetical protein